MKLVATDIDGTILPHGGEISDRTIAALAAAKAQGVHVVLVTARPPRWLEPVATRLGAVGQAIVANGAVVMDLGTGDVLESITFPASHSVRIAEVLRGELAGVRLATESARGISIEAEGYEHLRRFGPVETGEFESLEDVREERAFKILARTEGQSNDEAIARVAPLLAELAEVSHSGVSDGLLELAPVGVSKASGLERFAASLGVEAADVVAFGDAPNDVPMLRWAGRSFAMGGGHPFAHEAATGVADTAEADGVAQIVERLLGLAAR